MSNIPVSKIILEKTGQKIDDYVILEVCNPKMAAQALIAHKEIGLMLPCKIVVYKDGDGTLISLYRTTEAWMTLGFSDLATLAETIEKQLRQVVDLLLPSRKGFCLFLKK
jgi:uncharacterized protein (DUF302 family)